MTETPQRKNNRLAGFDYYSNAVYFVTVCARDRQNLFGDIVGGDAYIAPPYVSLNKTGKIADKYIKRIELSYDNAFVDKYAVMPNHIHMILALRSGTMRASSPTNLSLPAVIRSLKILISKECGFPVWQRSYYEHIIRNEDDYLRIWRYIDENPVKWKDDKYYTK